MKYMKVTSLVKEWICKNR